MSFETWHDYGYGICIDMIDPPTANQLRRFIDSSPETREELFRWLKRQLSLNNNNKLISTACLEKHYKNMTDDDLYYIFEDNDDGEGSGLAHIIHCVLNNKLKIGLLCCRDHNTDDSFVLIGMYYPWEISSFPNLEKIQTENDIKTIFAENIAFLTTQTVDELEWGYQSVEGFG